MVATLHLIHGFVGVGKTTFAKKLALQKNILRINFDEWMIEILGQNPHKNIFLALESKIKRIIWRTAARVLETGNDVILDDGFWTKESRDHYRMLAKSIGADVQLYNLQCPEEIMIKRALKRSAEMEKGALFIDANAFHEFKKIYEPLTPDESAILIDTTS